METSHYLYENILDQPKTYKLHIENLKNTPFSLESLEKKKCVLVDFIKNGGENFRALEVMTEYVFLPLGYLTRTAYAHSVFH